MLIFVFLFLYWSNSSFFCFVTPTCFSLFSFCWSKYPVFQLFPPIQLASLFFPLEQIFYFSAFPPTQLASSFCPLEQIFCFSAFPPIQLASSFFLLEQIFCFSAFSPNPACFSFLPVGANILFFNFLPQSSLLLLSARWSKYSVFQLFPPIQLASLFFPLEQMYCVLSLCPNSVPILSKSSFNQTPNQSPAAFRSSAIRFDIRFIGI